MEHMPSCDEWQIHESAENPILHAYIYICIYSIHIFCIYSMHTFWGNFLTCFLLLNKLLWVEEMTARRRLTIPMLPNYFLTVGVSFGQAHKTLLSSPVFCIYFRKCPFYGFVFSEYTVYSLAVTKNCPYLHVFHGI